jgi:hypothetical protein
MNAPVGGHSTTNWRTYEKCCNCAVRLITLSRCSEGEIVVAKSRTDDDNIRIA